MEIANREIVMRLWRSRVEDAKLRLDFARHFVKEANQAYRSGDGTVLANAIRAEKDAEADYLRVLRLCNELLLNGTVPDEDEWLRRRAAGDGGQAA